MQKTRPAGGRPFFRAGPKSRPTGKRPEHGPAAREEDGLIRIYGAHPVEAALANPGRQLVRLLATDNAARRLEDLIARRGVLVDPATPRDLDNILGSDAVHQGVLLECQPLDEPDLATLAELAAAEGGGPLVILDHVTDPHNAGAILRSAAAFGASGLVMTRRHSPPLNGTLAKAASGALEIIPVAVVQNLAKAMEDLKASGVTLIGLDGTANSSLEGETFKGPTALVMGAEGKGLRQLTAETCTRLVKVSTADSLASLNVSNAAAIALHCVFMKRNGRVG
jgi:23S rRNA (guanosine2251-2'-O)-methyltransferase